MKNSTKATIASIAVVIALVIAGAIAVMLNRPAAPEASQTDGALPGTRTSSHVLDEAGQDAPTLVEFLDFECEVCGAFYPYVEDIREQYAREINYVIRYFPLPGHFNSMNAALAVEAAAQQGEIEAMYHRMFETQAEWGEQQVSSADLFRSFADELGLDMTEYDAAIADPATQARIEETSRTVATSAYPARPPSCSTARSSSSHSSATSPMRSMRRPGAEERPMRVARPWAAAAGLRQR